MCLRGLGGLLDKNVYFLCPFNINEKTIKFLYKPSVLGPVAEQGHLNKHF